MRNPRRVVAILLGIAAACAAAFSTGIMLRERDDLGLFPPLAARVALGDVEDIQAERAALRTIVRAWIRQL